MRVDWKRNLILYIVHYNWLQKQFF
uniref:Uncharacterized protein n=1 Tax=Rhizophora mucronata TaxID=61149 RepID=A0A2P2IMA8_RHIMU